MPTVKSYNKIPEGIDHKLFANKNGVKISSKFKGVVFKFQANRHFYWTCRIDRKKLKFVKNFPFTERGEELAGIAYQNKINEINKC